MNVSFSKLEKVYKEYRFFNKLKDGYYILGPEAMIKKDKNSFLDIEFKSDEGIYYEVPRFYGKKYNLAKKMDIIGELKKGNYTFVEEIHVCPICKNGKYTNFNNLRYGGSDVFCDIYNLDCDFCQD